jgi:hypothetical protein
VIGGGDMDWMDRAQDKDWWRAVSCYRSNKPKGSIKWGISWLDENRLAPQEELCFM